jgi:hypothetical protein
VKELDWLQKQPLRYIKTNSGGYMVRPLDAVSSALLSALDEEIGRPDRNLSKTFLKVAAIGVGILFIGSIKAWDATKELLQREKVHLIVFSSLVAASAVIYPLAILASATALPVISMIGSVIGGMAFGLGVCSLGMILVISLVVAGISMYSGADEVTRFSYQAYNR